MSKHLALIDASVYAESVCDHAAWFAERTVSTVELVHVLGRRSVGGESANLSGSIGLGARSQLLDELSDLDEQRARYAQRVGRALLDDARERVLQGGVEQVTSVLRNGEIVETVVALEQSANLVLIGKRGEAADFDRMHLGSNLERVARSSHRPVLVASRRFKPISRCLIAFDGGASAWKAIDHLSDSLRLPGVQMEIFQVNNTPTNETRALDEAAERLRKAGYEVETRSELGQPDSTISARIETGQFDMLAMGAYGHSRIRNLIIGSTTTEMIRSCLVPVLLFR